MQIDNIDSPSSVCSADSYQDVEVCVPVKVKPSAKVGIIETICNGNPVIKQGIDICEGIENGECNFIISQKMHIKIPVEFNAETDTGETYVKCNTNPTYELIFNENDWTSNIHKEDVEIDNYNQTIIVKTAENNWTVRDFLSGFLLDSNSVPIKSFNYILTAANSNVELAGNELIKVANGGNLIVTNSDGSLIATYKLTVI